MSFLDRFIRKQKKEQLEKRAEREETSALLLEVDKKKPLKKSVATGKKVEQKEEAPKTAKIKTKKKLIADVNKILVKPLITEKISGQAAMGKYAFAVSSEANKIDVKKAVNALYGVKVVNVRIVNMMGKNVRYGKYSGTRSNWKKAIITLTPGEKIEIYEGV